MLENLTVLEMASGLARHSAARHRVLAENVANADTPGYRARDVEDFGTILKESFTARATRPGHVGGDGSERVTNPRRLEIDHPASPDGNNVNIEDQGLRAVETQSRHSLALSIYAKSMDLLRISLGTRR